MRQVTRVSDRHIFCMGGSDYSALTADLLFYSAYILMHCIIFCFYISSLNFFTFSAASPLKTAEPATMMLAPASRAALTLSVLIPPSTSMSA